MKSFKALLVIVAVGLVSCGPAVDTEYDTD